MATSVFLGEVTPVSKNIVTNLGFGKKSGCSWPVAAAIAFASRIGSVIFIIGLLVNLIMLVLKLTKTVDVDIWNYWGWAFAGGIVASVTNSFWLGCTAAAIYAVITLLLADHTAPMFQKYYGWPDISISHAGGMAIWLLQYPLSKTVRGSGMKDAEKESDLQKMREDVGIFGDPMMVGLMVDWPWAFFPRLAAASGFMTD